MNLSMLGFFKYGNFLLQNFQWLLARLGIIYQPPHLDILLPVGISFYTFHSLSYTLDIYRLGYYGGKGGRLIERLPARQGSPQADPPVGAIRARECQWETAHELQIPSDWPSGVYLGKLTEQNENLQSYVVFIVKDNRDCDFRNNITAV